MKVFSYVRVSSQGQVDKDGPVRQQDAIAVFCKANKLEHAREFFEDISGTVEGMDRPAFSEMVEIMDREHVNGVRDVAAIVVERMDRLARDLVVSEVLLRECRERGIKVFSADQGYPVDMATNDGDPMRKAMRQLIAVFAELEKSMLVRKMRLARERIRSEKGRCEGVLPYGSTAQEAEIKLLVAKMAGMGWTLNKIAETLNADGFTTRKGRRWNKSNLYTVISQRRCKCNRKAKQ